MAEGDRLGRVDERVRIAFGAEESRIVSRYEVSQRFFTQPAAFAVTIGSGETARELAKRFPPGTPFQLFIGGTVQQSGVLDGYGVSGSGGTELLLRGRDGLAPLHDSHVEADRSFSNLTYQELAAKCIEAAGIEGYSLTASNEANRSAIADTPITELQPLLPMAAADAARAGKPTEAPVVVDVKKQYIKAKVGQTWYAFLKKELDRAGLFLFACVDERSFILTAPQPAQRPAFRIARKRGAPRAAVNVVGTPRHRNEATGRHARYVVYGRGGGGPAGRSKTRGEYVDDEMVAWGFSKTWCVVDDDAKTKGQAQFLARRRCAEARRQGWELVYTVAGHRAPVIGADGRAGGRQYGIWAPDVVVDVQDDELGIHGPHWIEGVTFRGDGKSDGTTTEITLMRPEDLVFGDGP